MVQKIALFNLKGGVGKTTTTFYLGWMLASKGKRVILVDADPQCNLTEMVGEEIEDDEARIENIIYNTKSNIKTGLAPAFESQPRAIEAVDCIPIQGRDGLFLLPGHVGFAEYPEPSPPANTTQSAFSRFQISLGTARQERIIAIDVASWLENEIQQIHGSTFLQQSHTISSLIPVISNSIENKLNSNISWLEDEIRENLSFKSFQQPDKIADAIRLISDHKLWDEVAAKIGKPTKAIKQQLSSIVDRRNKIAHEADIDPTFNIGNRWNIDELLVNDAVDFIEQVVESIHQML